MKKPHASNPRAKREARQLQANLERAERQAAKRQRRALPRDEEPPAQAEPEQ